MLESLFPSQKTTLLQIEPLTLAPPPTCTQENPSCLIPQEPESPCAQNAPQHTSGWIGKQLQSGRFGSPDVVSIAVYDVLGWKVREGSQIQKKMTFRNALPALKELAQKKSHLPFGLVITTREDVALAAPYAAFLYLPGEMCRQTDIMEEAIQTSLPLVVERGPFLPPNELKRLADKLSPAPFALVECGSAHGYGDVILDPRALLWMQKTTPYWGLNLHHLLTCHGSQYPYKPTWLLDESFLEAFLLCAKGFEPRFFVGANP